MKTGFVSILGRPNVGKSTFINSVMGEKVSIVSNKPQTTRTKINIIYNEDDFQIVFTDTPGVHKPQTKLGECMVSYAKQSTEEVDLILFLIEPTTLIHKNDVEIIKFLKTVNCKIILVINKIDTIKKEKILEIIDVYSKELDFYDVIPISAKVGEGIDVVMQKIKSVLPEGPKYFGDDIISDQTIAEYVSELIREKLLNLLNDEIPHGIFVDIDVLEQSPKITKINATIFCEKESHKKIIIGKGGSVLKTVGTNARLDLEEYLGQKVYLELWVKIKENWRDSDFLLRSFKFEKK